MLDVVIDEPYQFVPPVWGQWWPQVLIPLLGRYLKSKFGVVSVDCRDVSRLKSSIEAEHGILLAPNHCRMSDPIVMGLLAKQCQTGMHAMASWHLFKQDWFTTFMTRRLGAFSVYREGVDRQAINTGVDILVAGKRPLIVFPEGAISRHNDVLMPLMDGTAFIARTAAKRREKREVAGGVVVHPIAIRYFFRGDLEATITPVLEEIESHFSWYPQRDKSVIVRLQQVGQALLSLKEVEYLGAARVGDFYERADNLIDEVLTKLETEWDISDTGEGVVARVKNLRSAILPDMVANRVSEEERHRRWKQLAACYYVQQMSHYPRQYVRRSEKNFPEHLLETVERFEEDFTDRVRTHGPLHAVIQVGESIPVSSARVPRGAPDPVMVGIRDQLTEMLAELQSEADRV